MTHLLISPGEEKAEGEGGFDNENNNNVAMLYQSCRLSSRDG